MRILSENSAINLESASPARRVAAIAAGLLLGAAISLANLHGYRAENSVASSPNPKALPADGRNPVNGTSMPKRDWHQVGLASWYGPQFQGKETANGEAFNMHDLTCAHRFLPLGTWLKVTNLHTRRWIVVRVNDRGPVPDTRIADLSSEAARMLGIHSRGVARVRLDVIDPQQAVVVARLDKLRLAKLAAQAEQTQPGD